MAQAIVPPDCNSNAVPDDFTALVHELMADEQTTKVEATTHALDLIDHLHAYAAAWDGNAYIAGNPDASADIKLSATVLDVVPSAPRQLVLIE